jgi:hypothetical protein
MSTFALKPLLIAVQACLDFARLCPDIRHVVRQHALEYEECLDLSLSEQLELVSGLVDAYTLVCDIKSEYFELGGEPRSHTDAVRQLDGFVTVARDAVSRALNDPTFAFPAQWISVRAQTFASLLRSTEAEATARDEPKPM